MRQQPGLPPGKMKSVAHEIGYLPAAEEKRRHQTGGGDDFGELAGEEHKKLATGIFHVITGDELGLSLRQIERNPFGFRDRRDKEKQERQRLKENAPGRKLATMSCKKAERVRQQVANQRPF